MANTTTPQTKIFILDTSVLLHDFSAILQFDEHDIVIPIHVLEELDNFKKGNAGRNLQAREFIRLLDTYAKDQLISEWVQLRDGRGKLKVTLDMKPQHHDAEEVYGYDKTDHKILNTALAIAEQFPEREVKLVSKDICLRLKASALNLISEDYETGKIKDVRDLYTGTTTMSEASTELIHRLHEEGEIRESVLNGQTPTGHHYFIMNNGSQSVLANYDANTGHLHRVDKKRVFNITPKNAEQAFALHALLNTEVPLVSIQGLAGTGKTLLALAAALEQRREYRQIFLTTPTIPLSNNDLGYLPGDIKAKMDPYMQSLWDNLGFIKSLMGAADPQRQRIEEMLETNKIAIEPLAYIRGRSLSRAYFIVDEAQNLTPHEVKTIISRAGEGTKMVFLGDVNQIDTPYLDSRSNGLTYLIDRVKGNGMFAHITLEKGERSELANLANALL